MALGWLVPPRVGAVDGIGTPRTAPTERVVVAAVTTLVAVLDGRRRRRARDGAIAHRTATVVAPVAKVRLFHVVRSVSVCGS